MNINTMIKKSKLKNSLASLILILLLSPLYSCTLVDIPALTALKINEEDPVIVTQPKQNHRDLLSSAYSEYNRQTGYVKVTLDFKDDSLRSVTFDSFDALGQPKTDYYNYAPHQAAMALTSRLKSLGASRIAELDAVSGATHTVNALKQAAIRAEQKARNNRQEEQQYYDGSYMGVSARTLRGWTTAVITILNDRITHVSIKGVSPATETLADGTSVHQVDENGNFIYEFNGADYPWAEYHQAIETLQKKYVEYNLEGLDNIDTVSRATVTCLETKQAVENALQAAKR